MRIRQTESRVDPAVPKLTPGCWGADAADANSVRMQKAGWGSLRPPSASDVRGRGGGTKGLAQAPPPLSHLVVLDFEWTADRRRRMEPCAEITQFPSVLVRLDGRGSHVVDEFDTFVRPTFNPRLTAFSTELTAITQQEVDAAPTLPEAMPRYLAWLRRHGLVDAAGRRIGAWCFCTWSDADIGGQLSSECRHKSLPLPPCFDAWVDLKVLYARHYRTEARGGLQACVERLGLSFEGRAHNGLIDSRNTAAITLHMAQGRGHFGPCFVFRRPTRGLDANGNAWGSKAARSTASARPAGESEEGRRGEGSSGSEARVGDERSDESECGGGTAGGRCERGRGSEQACGSEGGGGCEPARGPGKRARSASDDGEGRDDDATRRSGVHAPSHPPPVPPPSVLPPSALPPIRSWKTEERHVAALAKPVLLEEATRLQPGAPPLRGAHLADLAASLLSRAQREADAMRTGTMTAAPAAAAASGAHAPGGPHALARLLWLAPVEAYLTDGAQPSRGAYEQTVRGWIGEMQAEGMLYEAADGTYRPL